MAGGGKIRETAVADMPSIRAFAALSSLPLERRKSNNKMVQGDAKVREARPSGPKVFPRQRGNAYSSVRFYHYAPTLPATPPSPSSRFLISPYLMVIVIIAMMCFLFFGAAEARSNEYSSSSMGDAASQNNWRITCYTCVNVSNNEECNRYAIDRPCPEGGDYCLTLHVMEGKDKDRSLLVNKRCAALEDCIGDSTGCTTAYGQTQCVSCCDEPYCNDSVPSNETTAVFYRSSAEGISSSRKKTTAFFFMRIALILLAMKTFEF